MTPEQFAYWLQGFAELSGATPPTVEQWKSIREHLGTVFNKVTPEVKGAGAFSNVMGAPQAVNAYNDLQAMANRQAMQNQYNQFMPQQTGNIC